MAWPRHIIRELLTRAEIEGSATATLPSRREAELFRFAIYNFRRAEPQLGRNLSISINDSTIIVNRNDEVIIEVA